MPGNYECKHPFRLFHSIVGITTNKKTIHDDIEWLYGPQAINEGEIDVLLEITQETRGFRIQCGDYNRFFTEYWQALLFGIKARHLHSFWKGSSLPIAFHSASLYRDGRATLLVGADGAGKSTLALALGDLGFWIYSDEFGIVESDSLQVWPYPAPLALHLSAIMQRGLYYKQHLYEINIWASSETKLVKYLVPANWSGMKAPTRLSAIVVLDMDTRDGLDCEPLPLHSFQALLHTPPRGEFYIHGEVGGEASEASIDGFIARLTNCLVFLLKRQAVDKMCEVVSRIHEGVY